MENIEAVNQSFKIVGLPAVCVEEVVGYTYDIYKCKYTSLVNKSIIKNCIQKLEMGWGRKIIYSDKTEPMQFTLSMPKSKDNIVYPRYVYYRKEIATKDVGTMLMGIDMQSQTIYRNIQDTKSILIAGSSGGGKSVYMNNLILSLLDNENKSGVDLYMVDLKQTELTIYDGILGVSSVATTFESAIETLESLKSEIARRYEIMKEQHSHKATINDFPIKVCFIDEYAMLTAIDQDKVDNLVAHIASVGRACNVYLVIATQHPRSDVISNLIKANIQSRVCLRTLNTAQSVSIIGNGEGINLLGRGDALMQIDGELITHIQGCNITESDYQAILGD